MRGAWTIATREFASMFRVPLGWVVIALFLALSGLVFVQQAITPGEPATMRTFFNVWWQLLVFLAPAVSMRLLSDELRSGTIEPLLTAPVSELAVAVGKYTAAVLFLLAMLVPTLAYVGVLISLAEPDMGSIIAGYAGIVLLGMLYLSVGLLASSLTSSQTLAFLSTMFVLLLAEIALVRGAAALPPGSAIGDTLLALAPTRRLVDFSRGLIPLEHVAFFVGGSAFFVALTVVSLEVRRWR